jgi:naphthalene 1,2-dioxygenase system ferredoxin subunit
MNATTDDTTRWHDVAAADDVPDGDVIAAQAAGRDIALVRLGAELFAIDATCTHGAASLCGGFVEPDGSIECPLHQGRFDVKTGRALCAPLTEDLLVHAVRIEDGRLWVRLHAAAQPPR